MRRGALRIYSQPFLPFTSCLTSSKAVAHQLNTCPRSPRRDFSTSAACLSTVQRSQMFAWLKTRGKNFETPFEGDTNYITDYEPSGFRKDDYARDRDRDRGRDDDANRRPRRPFPLNDHFVSQPILSKELREEIWKRVQLEKKSVRAVSVELGVDMRRVGAVVRLQELEKKSRSQVSIRLLISSNSFYRA